MAFTLAEITGAPAAPEGKAAAAPARGMTLSEITGVKPVVEPRSEEHTSELQSH